MTAIIQITPEIGPGTGVGAVAHHLEEEWRRSGLDVQRFTLAEAGGDWLPSWTGGLRGKLALAARVVWFSTVGTRRARRHLARRPELLSVCHNDALAGDVYVNHGIVQAAMRSRGQARWRLARNPLHLFTTARDRRRYSSASSHRLVVNLVSGEDELLRQVYPRLALPTAVIGNGVDIDKFQPATGTERTTERERLGVRDADHVVLFIGNEFARKGLPVLVEALDLLDAGAHLVVVGGTPDLVQAERSRPAAVRLGHRLHFVGPQPDPRPWLHAADVLATPSSYESYGLVVLEALACGVPVVGTATGCLPDVVTDGVNGAVVAGTPPSLADGLRRVLALPRAQVRAAARAEAETHSWAAVAERYLDVLTAAHGSGSGPAR